MAPEPLSDRDVAILAFEAKWPRHSAAKEEAMREVFGLPAARYLQLLHAVIDSPAALEHDPVLIHRLQRARAARIRVRASRTFEGRATTR